MPTNRQRNFRSTANLEARLTTGHQSQVTSHQSPIFPQHRDKMQPPSKQRAERKRINRDAVIPALDRQTGLRKIAVPLRPALIVVGQHDTVRTIAHPVHELQRLEIKTALGQMVLDQNKSPADAATFGKKPRNSLPIRRMV